MMEEVWTLWSDESRAGGEKPLVAAGLLLHSDTDDTLAALKWEIQESLPWVPWPVHATEVHRAGMHLAWMARDLGRVPQALRPFVETCLERCRRGRAERALELLMQTSSNGRSHRDWFAACRVVEDHLSGSGGAAWQRIVEATRNANKWLRSAFLAAAQAIEVDGTGYLVASSDSAQTPPVALFERLSAGRREPEWKEVVAQLAVRALDLLGMQRRELTLQLSPLDHRMTDSATGASRSGGVGQLLDAVSREVTVFKTGHPDPKKRARFRHAKTSQVVTVLPAVGHAYEVSSGMAHVWADWLAFELRNRLRKDRNLADLGTDVVSAVGWTVAPAASIPTVAASGGSASSLGALRRGQPTAEASDSSEPLAWAKEQAEIVGPQVSVWGLT